jgi:hypothetical protein
LACQPQEVIVTMFVSPEFDAIAAGILPRQLANRSVRMVDDRRVDQSSGAFEQNSVVSPQRERQKFLDASIVIEDNE